MDLSSAILILIVLAAMLGGAYWLGRMILLKRARGMGFELVGVYLRAVPRTDEQKLDAVDLAAKGILITVMGLIFTPLIIVGLVPLYYGLRKVTTNLMGLGIVDSPSN